MNLGNIKVSITDEEINNLPLKHFEGEIFVVENLKEFKKHLEYLSIQSVLGFDTETKPSFKKGVKHEISLLQLSANGKAFLFRLNKIGLPKELAQLLSDPSIVKVGLALKDDVKGLQRIDSFKPDGFLDLQDYVKFFHIEHFGLRKLAALLLNFRISKAQRLTNWEVSPLTEKQQVYAATDAWVTLEIYKRLKLIELTHQS
jgi:ribonuclease D